jgi:hypothetical protein
MAIQKPRKRLVNIRLSNEEFVELQHAINESKSRTISDFCRNAILKSIDGSGNHIQDIQSTLGRLETLMTGLAGRMAD